MKSVTDHARTVPQVTRGRVHREEAEHLREQRRIDAAGDASFEERVLSDQVRRESCDCQRRARAEMHDLGVNVGPPGTGAAGSIGEVEGAVLFAPKGPVPHAKVRELDHRRVVVVHGRAQRPGYRGREGLREHGFERGGHGAGAQPEGVEGGEVACDHLLQTLVWREKSAVGPRARPHARFERRELFRGVHGHPRDRTTAMPRRGPTLVRGQRSAALRAAQHKGRARGAVRGVGSKTRPSASRVVADAVWRSERLLAAEPCDELFDPRGRRRMGDGSSGAIRNPAQP